MAEESRGGNGRDESADPAPARPAARGSPTPDVAPRIESKSSARPVLRLRPTSREPVVNTIQASRRPKRNRAGARLAEDATEARSPAPSAPLQRADGDPWTVPQSVRDRFVQDGHRFYFPDGAPAFQDLGRKLTTTSENTQIVYSLIEIAHSRGWTEVRVSGTERFRREAWQQARLAGLGGRGRAGAARPRALARPRPLSRARRCDFRRCWNTGAPKGGDPGRGLCRRGGGARAHCGQAPRSRTRRLPPRSERGSVVLREIEDPGRHARDLGQGHRASGREVSHPASDRG
jgi:Large polyvalent protein-associated domain 7